MTYRDGMDATRKRLEEERADLLERWQQLGEHGQKRLPEDVREELKRLAEPLEQEIESNEEAAAVEAVLAGCQQRLRDAKNLLAQLDAADRRQSRTATGALWLRLRPLWLGLRRRPGWLIGALAVLVAVAGATRWQQRRAEDCAQAPACAAEGACVLAFPRHGLSLECVVGSNEDCIGTDACWSEGRCSQVGLRCEARTDDDCRRMTKPCLSQGLCTAQAGRCRATKAADCEASALCKGFYSEGRCTPRDGVCVVSDASCGSKWLCVSRGHCSAGPDGSCVVGSEHDCLRSSGCQQDGRCKRVVVDGVASCVTGPAGPATAADCSCADDGRCAVRDGSCVASDALRCRQSQGCQHSGLCSLRGEGCVAAEDADCRRSEACRSQGKCRAHDGACLAVRDEDCEIGSACRRHGRCTVERGSCRPRGQAHCLASLECLTMGRCSYDTGVEACMTQPVECGPTTPICKVTGRCETGTYGCVATLQSRCEKTERCATHGECSFVEEGLPRCAVASDADCKQSQACKKHKRCRARDGRCISSCAEQPDCLIQGVCTDIDGACRPGSDGDCAAAMVCALYGRCSYDGAAKDCVASDTEHCKASAICRQEGSCSLDTSSKTCVVASDEDCTRSVQCSFEARCSWDAKGGRCIRGSSDDCAKSGGCKERGLCTLTESGLCAAETAEDCRRGGLCQRRGACTAKDRYDGDGCMASNDADCEASEGCKRLLRCVYRDGQCRISCKYTRECLQDGRCRDEDDRCAQGTNEPGDL